jgi:hypothetical protein
VLVAQAAEFVGLSDEVGARFRSDLYLRGDTELGQRLIELMERCQESTGEAEQVSLLAAVLVLGYASNGRLWPDVHRLLRTGLLPHFEQAVEPWMGHPMPTIASRRVFDPLAWEGERE